MARSIGHTSLRARALVVAFAIVLSAAAVIFGFADWTNGHQANAPAELTRSSQTVFVPLAYEADRAYLLESFEDVAKHVDAIALGTPVDEAELPDSEVIERGEGLLGRRITVRIDDVLWQRTGAPSLPPSLQTSGGSWSYDRGTRTPVFFFGELGRQYVFVFEHNDDPHDTDSYEWLHEGELGVPITEGRTPSAIESEKPYLLAIQGKTPAELRALFAAELGAGA